MPQILQLTMPKLFRKSKVSLARPTQRISAVSLDSQLLPQTLLLTDSSAQHISTMALNSQWLLLIIQPAMRQMLHHVSAERARNNQRLLQVLQLRRQML